ncbi:MAG: copper chaperone PCu(A)C [Alphaproteobacteria bacterium]|nr:copper chaperone PCu(A)C [Alphaproteobacteria bacterium]
MRRLIYSCMAAVVLASCGQTSTQTAADAPAAAAAAVTIEDGWAAVTPNGASVAAGYGVIRNNATAPDRLIGASSPMAGRVEIHEMVMDGAVMQMREWASFTAPARGAVTLEPGGAHIMFMDIAGPFREGDSVPLTLVFENAGAVEASLPVRPRSGGGNH